MPKLPIDYSKTIIYKIVCLDTCISDCYVGHTTDFTRRKATHKQNCNNPNNSNFNLKVYKTIRDNGGWENWQIVMIETFECKNKLEATKRERECYEELKATLNMVRPFISQEELKEYNVSYKKKHYETNKEKYAEQHKHYSEEHKEQIQEYKIKYYEANKDKIREYKKEYHKQTIECKYCNTIFNKTSLNKHIKRKHTEK